MDNWQNLPFPERDDAILERMAGHGMNSQRFDVSLHVLADAWCVYITNQLRGETGDEAATAAEIAIATINGICGEIGLPPYSDGVYGDALETAHAMVMQAYARR